MPLSAHQKDAYYKVSSRINAGHKYTSLTGHAGAGKTYVASRIANSTGGSVVATAPTHKAAWVLDQKVSTKVRTIHSLLGLAMVRDNDGGYTLVKKKKSPVKEDVVIVDEGSMAGSRLWEHIDAEEDTQWLFVGDPAQLNPPREQPSPALEQEGAHLSEVVRQKAGSPILDFAHRIRTGRDYLASARHGKGGGVAPTGSKRHFLESAVRGFSGAAPDAPPEMRVLAYTNRKVDEYNQAIRQMLHPGEDIPEYMPGDWLMMGETFREERETVAKNAEEVKVIAAHPGTMRMAGQSWNIWNLTVRRPQSGGIAVLPVIRRSDQGRYKKELRERAHAARNDQRDWKDYYWLLEGFARPDYAYALTTHRSQGSTLKTAYVDHRDLQRCRNPKERQSLAYVACTRPSTNLALLV